MNATPATRCRAQRTDRSGQCKNRPIRGAVVCRCHGGSAPQVRRSAAQRLAALADPALDRLATILSRSVRSNDLPSIVRTCFGILDRCGHGPKSGVELSGPNGAPMGLALLSDADLAARARDLLGRIEQPASAAVTVAAAVAVATAPVFRGLPHPYDAGDVADLDDDGADADADEFTLDGADDAEEL